MRARSLLLVALAPTLLLQLLGACASSGTGSGDGDGDNDGGTIGGIPPCVVDGLDLEGDLPNQHAVTKEGAVPDMTCFGAPEQLGASEPVTIEGCADIFGLGNKCKSDTYVAVFSRDQDPSTESPDYGEVRMSRASEPGDLQTEAAACESECFYRLDNVPTHENLIFKVYEDNDTPTRITVDTYTYDIVLRSADAVDGVIDYEANLVVQSTLETIAPLAGKYIDGQEDISDGVGRGAIAGEIHDCQDRLIQGAVVGTSAFDNEMVTVYFNGDEDDPQPDQRVTSTNNDGLYAHINVATAPGTNDHHIVAGIRETGCDGDDCQCIAFGESNVKAFPDSVTIITLRGDLPVTQ